MRSSRRDARRRRATYLPPSFVALLRRGAVAVGAALLLLVVAAPALADVEPNDGITQAEGPLAAGVAQTGVIANPEDLDTYMFYVSGQQQLDIHFEKTDPEPGCLTASLGNAQNANDADESRLLRDETAGASDFKYTTPQGTNRYYLELWSCTSDEDWESYEEYEEATAFPPIDYSFTISPAAALAPGENLVRQPQLPTGEPNETWEQAAGPLRGGVPYVGAQQTANDTDWFKFYTRPGKHRVSIRITELGKHGRVDHFSYDPDSEETEGYGTDAEVSKGATRSMPYRALSLAGQRGAAGGPDMRIPIDQWSEDVIYSTEPAVYYIDVRANEDFLSGEPYELIVEPADALTTTPPNAPAPPPSPCAVAQKRLKKASVRRKRLSRKIRRDEDRIRFLRRSGERVGVRRKVREVRYLKHRLKAARQRVHKRHEHFAHQCQPRSRSALLRQ